MTTVIELEKAINDISKCPTTLDKIISIYKIYNEIDEKIAESCTDFAEINYESLIPNEFGWSIDEKELKIDYNLLSFNRLDDQNEEDPIIKIPIEIFHTLKEEKITDIIYAYLKSEKERIERKKTIDKKYREYISKLVNNEKEIEKLMKTKKDLENETKYTQEFKEDQITKLQNEIEARERIIYNETLRNKIKEYEMEMSEAEKRLDFIQYYYDRM